MTNQPSASIAANTRGAGTRGGSRVAVLASVRVHGDERVIGGDGLHEHHTIVIEHQPSR
ncbi:hypothetical protein [Nocardia thailandica]